MDFIDIKRGQAYLEVLTGLGSSPHYSIKHSSKMLPWRYFVDVIQVYNELTLSKGDFSK